MGAFSKLFSRRPAADPLDALLAEASRNPMKREAFYRALLDASLWMPGEIERGELMARPYQVFGRDVLLAFTARENASALRDKPAMVELPARTVLAAGAAFEGMILNYGTPTEKEFTVPEMRGLLDGSIFDLVEGEGALLLGQPKEYPVRLMNDLARALPSRPGISAAYIAQVAREGEMGAPTIVIGIEAVMTDSEFEEVRPKLERLAESAGAPGTVFMKLAADPIAEYMRTETKAFYNSEF